MPTRSVLPGEPKRLVVLASGMGSRLRAKATAKPLVRLTGTSLIERTLATAHEAGFEQVIVVTGYRSSEVDQHVFAIARRRGFSVRIVHNDRYEEGNGLAVLAARAVVGDEPFALIMGDHVFAPSLLARLRDVRVRPAEVLVFVDRLLGRAVGVDTEDAMKVTLEENRVCSVSKDLPVYDAFDVGAFVCTQAIFEAIEIAMRRGDSSLAGAIQVLASRGQAQAVEVKESEWWFDVDTPRDLHNGARFLLRGAGKALDGALAARVNRVLSQRVVTPVLLRAGHLTPNQVTLVAFAAALVAALMFAAGAPVAAALLVWLASVLDGSDGEVARLTYRSSPYGGFLDATLDRAADSLLLTGAGIYLARSASLAELLGALQVPVALGITGLAITGHLLVSYTSAKAAVDLGHRYEGRLVGSGHGRDLRLGILTAGALGAWFHPICLATALALVGLLGCWITIVRLTESWWALGPGQPFFGVRAVALDFDGTVADSMGFLTDLAVDLLVEELGFDRPTALERYRATAGADFSSQLEELAPCDPRCTEVARHFEAAKADWMENCSPFDDVPGALARLAKLGIPVLVCSSTRVGLVQDFFKANQLEGLVTTISGWAPGRDKRTQLASWLREQHLIPDTVVFVGDARRDEELAKSVGVRFVGVVRPGQPDLLAGSAAPVVSSLLDLAAAVERAHRTPVRLTSYAPGQRDAASHLGRVTEPQHQRAISLVEEDGSQVADVIGTYELPSVTHQSNRGDRAVRHPHMAVDRRSGLERPGDSTPDHRVVREHDRSTARS
ncbi:MAG: NTP transferase domain-containing protein [Acidimicrobiales bacterium]|nr:NTP transferase domain-containing protein [Acidimicrobiales bacterium]